MKQDLALDFCPRLRTMLELGSSTDEKNQPVKIAGGSTTNNILCLREVILRHQYQKTLEIGLAYGCSALAILSTLSEIYKDRNFSHTAIDPYQKQHFRNSSLKLIQEEGLSQYFRFLEESSMIALPALIKAGEKFDLIYVDGSHLFGDVFTDFYFSTRLLNQGGMILFDDCVDSHVRKVIRFIYKNCSHFLEPVNLLSYIKKPFLKRLSNQLGYRQLEAFTLVAEPNHTYGKKLKHF